VGHCPVEVRVFSPTPCLGLRPRHNEFSLCENSCSRLGPGAYADPGLSSSCRALSRVHPNCNRNRAYCSFAGSLIEHAGDSSGCFSVHPSQPGRRPNLCHAFHVHLTTIGRGRPDVWVTRRADHKERDRDEHSPERRDQQAPFLRKVSLPWGSSPRAVLMGTMPVGVRVPSPAQYVPFSDGRRNARYGDIPVDLGDLALVAVEWRYVTTSTCRLGYRLCSELL
jgi:hypothetical protein